MIVIPYHQLEGLTILILYLVKLNCPCSVLIEDIISLNMEWISNISYKIVNRHQEKEIFIINGILKNQIDNYE